MAVGKNKRVSKGGRKGAKKKISEPMLRKEWYDVIAPATFSQRQAAKTICNKTSGLKIAADNLRGRVFDIFQADLDKQELTSDNKDQDSAFRRVKLEVMEVQGRNLLTQFHSLHLTTDKQRSLIQKWGTLIEAQIEAKTADGYTLRLFITAFTKKQKNQLSKNSYAPTRLEKWIRYRMTKIVQKRLAKANIDDVVKMLTTDVLINSIAARCNPILPLRDVKFTKVKTIRRPKLDVQKLLDSHGAIPESDEGKERVIIEVAPAEVETAAEEPKAE